MNQTRSQYREEEEKQEEQFEQKEYRIRRESLTFF